MKSGKSSAWVRVGLAGLAMAVLPTAGCRRSSNGPAAGGPASNGPAAPAPAAGQPSGVSPTDATATAAVPPRGKQIAIAYSSNMLAEYEQCGCPVHPQGGLARRATLLDRARAESDAVLVLDAGDLLLPAGPLPPPARDGAPPARNLDEVTRRAHLMLGALARLGVAAFAPGEHDLAIGPALLRRLLAEHHIPAVSANLTDDRGDPLFDPDRLLDLAGVKVGVFGIITAAPEDAALWSAWGLAASDPVASATREVGSLRARGAAIVIALVHAGTHDQAQAILRAVPGIDWAVLGHSAMNFETPEPIGSARALEAMSGGRDFGRLDLHLVGGDPRAVVDRGRHAQLRAILGDHQRQIAELRARAEEQPPVLQARTAERIARLEKAIADDQVQLAAHPAEIRGSWFENQILPLDAGIADQPGVATLVAAYNRESQRRASAGLPVGVAVRSGRNDPHAPVHPRAAPAPAEKLAYLGTAACGACHAAALALWKNTAHGRAFATLEKKGRERDPACVGCHVTGYLRPGGTADVRIAATRLRDVGCEACHGPGADHRDAVMIRPQIRPDLRPDLRPALAAHAPAPTARPGSFQREVPALVCLGCHTPDQTGGDFEYGEYLKAILGPGHGGV